MPPSSNLFCVSIDEVLDSIEHQLNYHKHNAERYKDGLRHNGQVEGIQGRQSQAECNRRVAEHTGAIQGLEFAKRMIQALVPVEDFESFFGAGHESYLKGWGPQASTFLHLDGKRTIESLTDQPDEGYVETGLDHAIKSGLPLND